MTDTTDITNILVAVSKSDLEQKVADTIKPRIITMFETMVYDQFLSDQVDAAVKELIRDLVGPVVQQVFSQYRDLFISKATDAALKRANDYFVAIANIK